MFKRVLKKLLVGLVVIAFILPVLPSGEVMAAGGMQQVLVNGNIDLLNTGATEYNHLQGAHNWSATEAECQQYASAAGKLKKLYVELNDSPGAGKSYDFTIRVGGAEVGAPTVHIHDTDTSGSDLVNEIAVAAGDLVGIKVVPTGTPTARVARWSAVFESDVANESLILGGTNDAVKNSATEYNSIMGGAPWSGTQSFGYQVIPTGGTISHLYVKLSVDPGTAPDAYRFTLMIEAAAQTLTCTITADDTTGSDVANSVAVSAGDIVTLRQEPLNSPSAAPYIVWGMKFTSTIDGESLILGGSSSGLDPAAAEYNFITPGRLNLTWTATEADHYMLAQAMTLKKLYVKLENAPGDGKSYTFTSRVAGGAGNLSVLITGAATTTGNDVVHTDVLVAGNEVDICCTPAGTPAAVDAYWGLVGFIAVRPTVTTQAATNIEDTTATGNGNITDTGNGTCDIRGIVWDTTSYGDPGNVSPAVSDYDNDVAESNGFGTGAFTRSLTGLPTGDTIYCRAYAHNANGYAYGSEVNFLTKPAAPTNVLATDGEHTDKVVVTWTKSTGATGYKVYEGANLLDTLGDVATFDDTTAPAGIITPGTATASDGTSVDHVTLSLAGESVADGASRTYKVVALNGTGDSDDSTTNEGYRTTGAITYQWQRSAADSDASYSLLSGATTDPYNDTTAPSNGDGRWYYCEVSATGTTTQDSTHNRGYRIAVPTVTTQAATNIEDTTATGNGNIVDTNNGNCSAWGICWNTTGNPDTGDNTVAGSGVGGVGAFTANLVTLPTGTTIHTKAYATNAAGTGYGAEEDFLTKPAAPTGVSATDGTETSKVVITWTKSTGATDYHVWRGAVDLGSAGDVATFDDTGATAGTITSAGVVTASDGTSTAHVTLSLAGEATSNGTVHTYKVVASNATGDSDDSLTNTGYRGVGTITYQWQVNDGGGYDNIVGGTTDPYNYEGAPAGIITPGTASATDGTSTAHVTLSLAGESVADGATYTYQCIVSSVDASNTPQTSDNNTGYRGTGALTYAWQRSSGDSNEDYSPIAGGTTDPYDDTAAPAGVITPGTTVATDGDSTAHVSLSLNGSSVADGAGRYFKCILSATGTSNATSTNDRGYRTTGALTYQWKRSDADSDADYNTNLGTNSTYDDAAAPAPTITAGSTVATDGTETAHVALSLTGSSANVGAGRYYICVQNATGTTEQTSATNRGYRGVGALTYQWQKSSGTGDEDYSNIDGATNSTYNDTAAPAGSITNAGTVTASVDEYLYVTLSLASEATTDGAVRYFKCTLNATGATQQVSAPNDGYRGAGVITFAWQRSAADSDASYSPIAGATTDPYNDTEAPAGTITPGIATASDGIAEAYVTLIVSGHTTTGGAGRYFKCIVSSVDASNSPQTSNNARGYRVVGALTYTWERSDADSDAGYNTEIGTTNPYNDTSAPADGSGRYFRCLLDATGATQAETTHDRGYRATSGWEQLITGDNADGDDIYGVNWAAQQFTAGSVSHSVTSVRVKIKRVGTPGTVTLSLRDANAIYHPIGLDYSYATLDGDTLSTAATWYEFTLSGISLEAGESFALVMRAPSGDAANYIEWRWDSDGGLDDAIASLSIDAGITWTVNAGGADYLFEILGDPLIEMIGAQVFGDYVGPGDWLIALTYKNEYVPYYPNENPAFYFNLQLLDGIVVKSQTSCVAWGYRPGSIYLSKALADTLEWGATDYTIRLYGDFGTNPAAEYLLTSIDWRGTDLDLLDDWVIAQAKDIGNGIGITLVVPIADQGEVLNSYGHAMFSIGIPRLNEVRPELFEMVSQKPPYTEEDYTGDLQDEEGADWETRLGPQISQFLTDGGVLIGVSGDFMGGILIFLGFLGAVVGLGLAGHLVVGLSLSYPILLVGGWFDLVSWVIIGVITFFMAVIFVYKVWFTR